MFKRPETQMPTSSSRGKETGVFPRMERQTAKRASTAPITAGVIMGEKRPENEKNGAHAF